MPKFVVLITARIEDGHEIGNAWRRVGAPGVTIVEGYGLHRLQESAKSRELLPGMMSMLEILRQGEQTSLIIFTVVADDSIVDNLIAAAEKILGPLTEPDNGVLFTLNADRVVGVRDHGRDAEK